MVGWREKLIKEISINFSEKKNRVRTQHKHNLLKQFRNIKSKSDRYPRNRDLYNKINNEIKSLEIQEATGAKNKV